MPNNSKSGGTLASRLWPAGRAALFTAPELLIVLLIAAVQFVSILEFMILMPLGPDLAKALAIDPSNLGLIGGAYTAAAAVSGLLAAMFLDRFDRRPALATAMAGLVIATALGACAWNLHSLLAARMLAGMFGGPATALGLAIVADYFAPHKRGRAMGAVMGGFTLASVVGVPLGLQLAQFGGWRLPLLTIAGLGAVVIGLVAWRMPPVRAHLSRPRRQALAQLAGLLQRPVVLLSLAAVMLSVCGSFAVIPNISAYIQFNHGYPHAELGLLYLAGGLVSFLVMQFAGGLADRYSPALVAIGGAVVLAVALLCGFVFDHFYLPIIAVFVLFMSAQGIRNVAVNALTSRVPGPHERASYQSAQAAVQSLAMALGGIVSAYTLRQLPSHELAGMPSVALAALAMGVLAPLLLIAVQRMVVSGEAQRGEMQDSPAPDAATGLAELEPEPAVAEV